MIRHKRRTLSDACVSFAGFSFMLVFGTTASAQYLPATVAPVQLGQVHLYVSDIDAQKQFWTTLGTEAGQVLTANIGVIKFPNVVFFVNERATPAEKNQT